MNYLVHVHFAGFLLMFLQLAFAEKIIVKRQNAPSCGASVSGSVSATASAGTPVSNVVSSDPAGLSIWYTISDPTFNQAFNINPYTGAISVGSNFASIASGRNSASFTVQTTNAAGGTCSTPVTISISGGGGSSGGSSSGATRVVDTCGCGAGYYCFQGICYSIFGSASNAFTITTCTAGTTVGSVSVGNTYNYGISAGSGNFYINNAGTLFVGNTLTSGTYTIPVISYLYGGSTSITTATVTASCSGSTGTFCVGSVCFNTGSAAAVTTCANGGFSILGLCFNETTSTANSVGAPFAATSYAFTTSACTAGATVGTVSASGATGYSIAYGFREFTVSSTGAITLLTALTAGTYSVSVVARTATGFQTAVPVTVTVVCATG